MENFATRFADLLETTAVRVRSLTVDRAANVIRIVMLVIPTTVFGFLAIVFLFMTIHRALAIPLGTAAAHAIIAGLFALGAMLLWSKREPQEEQ